MEHLELLCLTLLLCYLISPTRLRSCKYKTNSSAVRMNSASPLKAVCVVLYACLLLPTLNCENLLCYYCPLQSVDRDCHPILSECPPQELCFTARGRYGGRAVLSAGGCMSEQDCQLEHMIFYKGANINMSYSCCDWHYCNSGSRITVHLVPVVLVAAAAVTLADTWVI